MRDVQRLKCLSMGIVDVHILFDVLSMSVDACSANAALYERVTSRFEQDVFQCISVLYLKLSEHLLRCLEGLPRETGSMNPEPGYIGRAYLIATKAPTERAPNRVMVVNKQALKRIKRLVAKLNDRQFAESISEYLASIQLALDNIQFLQNQDKQGISPVLVKSI